MKRLNFLSEGHGFRQSRLLFRFFCRALSSVHLRKPGF
jgi:hypothetical protein